MNATIRNERALADYRQRISEETGFDAGERFETPAQVREYFNRELLCSLFSDRDIAEAMPTQERLDEYAADVIRYAWHCTFSTAD